LDKNDTYRITIEENPNPGDIQTVVKGLDEYNFARTDQYHHRVMNIFLRDPDGGVKGGLIGATFWGWLHVDILWVDENQRQKGSGRELLLAAEKEAARRGCRFSHLETHSFQALDFYLKQGYAVYGQLEDFPAGHTKYFLSKSLSEK